MRSALKAIIGWKVGCVAAVVAFLLVAGLLYGGEDGNRLKVQKKVDNIKTVSALKSSQDWITLTNQLAQYEAHYDDYTNRVAIANSKIALVTDTKTQTALQKVMDAMDKQGKMLDDVHDAVKKMKRIVADLVNVQ